MIGALALAVVVQFSADEIPADKAAKIERSQEKAQAEISKKYGDRKPSAMTSDERRAQTQERSEADQKVLDKAGIDRKDWAISSMKRSRETTGKVKEAKVEQAKKEQADAAKAKAPVEPQGEVTVQKGFSEDSPTVLEEKPGAPPIVESSMPKEVRDDQKAAQEASGGDEKDASKPAAKSAPRK